MPIVYKIDVLARLKAAGYSSYRLIQEKTLSPSTVQRLRTGEPISWDNIERICRLLNCQPGDVLEYKE